MTVLFPKGEDNEHTYYHMTAEGDRYFYEYLIQRMETMEIEFEPEITYDELNGWYHVRSDICEKYPLYSIRGTCHMEQECKCEPICCKVNNEPCCFDKKVGCSATSAIKYPEYYEFLPELVLWMAVCPDLDAVYVMHDYPPVIFGSTELTFEFAFLLKDNKITYIKVEDMMNNWDENAPDFHF